MSSTNEHLAGVARSGVVRLADDQEFDDLVPLPASIGVEAEEHGRMRASAPRFDKGSGVQTSARHIVHARKSSETVSAIQHKLAADQTVAPRRAAENKIKVHTRHRRHAMPVSPGLLWASWRCRWGRRGPRRSRGGTRRAIGVVSPRLSRRLGLVRSGLRPPRIGRVGASLATHTSVVFDDEYNFGSGGAAARLLFRGGGLGRA